MRLNTALLALAITAAVAACAHSPPTIPPVKHVDIARFMGDWYVIAHIPTLPEREAYNAVESYALRPDGRIQTTFRFNNGAYDGPVKTMHPIGTVRPRTGNAVWGMQFVWPIKAEYVIVFLDPDYRTTIIGRSDRDYAWIMARSPSIPEAEYRQAVERLRQLGYTTDAVRKVPQRWTTGVSP